MNIILIIVDTLRYDYLATNGNTWIRTPNVDRLAEKSWVFDMSFSASYPTIPNRTDVITGKYGNPIHPWRPLRWDHLTFPEILAESGYCTQLIHDTPHLVNGGHNFDYPFHAWTPVRGAEVDRPWIDEGGILLDNWKWDSLYDTFDINELRNSTSIQARMLKTYCSANRRRNKYENWNAAKLFRTASKWLRENIKRNRFFLWIDCFDPHEPWDVPPEYARMYVEDPGYDGSIDPRAFIHRNSPLFPEAGKKRQKAWYAAKVSWVDHWFGELLNTLDETSLREQTAIVFTADHGTNVGEYNQFGKSFPVREWEAHIPFMVSVPGEESGRSNIFVQSQDVFATVLGIAGLPVPGRIDSQDVLAQAHLNEGGSRQLALSGIAVGERKDNPGSFFTIFDKDYYLIFDPDPEKCQLIRYGSQVDIAASHSCVVERLHATAIDELERRGADPQLVMWLHGKGEAEFPNDCIFWDGYPGPAGYVTYFKRNYGGD